MGKVLDEMSRVSNLLKQFVEILGVNRLIQANDTLDYDRVKGNSFSRNHMAKKGNLVHLEGKLTNIGIEVVLTKNFHPVK